MRNKKEGRKIITRERQRKRDLSRKSEILIDYCLCRRSRECEKVWYGMRPCYFKDYFDITLNDYIVPDISYITCIKRNQPIISYLMNG